MRRVVILVEGKDTSREVINRLSLLGVSASYEPRNDNELCIVQKRVIASIGIPAKCSNIIVVDDSDLLITYIVGMVSTLFRRDVYEIAVGIDTGLRPAYAIIVDGILTDYGFLENAFSLANELCRIVEEVKPRHAVVRVGGAGEGVDELIKIFSNCKLISIELVDEVRTSSHNVLPSRYGRRGLSKHVMSAIQIALKKGVKVVT